jgi:oligopeptide/dipeptide ABC transporter ATP-binding protein
MATDSRTAFSEQKTLKEKTVTPLLKVQNLVKEFRVKGDLLFSKTVHAVSGISFTLMPGQSIGIVGESGSGKTTVARCIMGLSPPTAGEILFKETSIYSNHSALKEMRRNVQMVFQDPVGSLNPRFSVDRILRESLIHCDVAPRRDLNRMVQDLLDQVGMTESERKKLPHQLSGGQQQRVSIARALAPRPNVLVLDEPTSALDVSLQAQIVNLLRDLRRELGLAYILITHQFSIVRQLCDVLLVMYLGKPMEMGPTAEIINRPRHPYSRALIGSIPLPDPSRRINTPPLTGEIPSPINPPSGCWFHPRCPQATEICSRDGPLSQQTDGVTVWCHLRHT